MVKLLVAGGLVLLMGVAISRMNNSSGAPATAEQAQTQINQARQDINKSMAAETQRAAKLSTINPQQPDLGQSQP
jgi:hypothetical protein